MNSTFNRRKLLRAAGFALTFPQLGEPRRVAVEAVDAEEFALHVAVFVHADADAGIAADIRDRNRRIGGRRGIAVDLLGSHGRTQNSGNAQGKQRTTHRIFSLNIPWPGWA